MQSSETHIAICICCNKNAEVLMKDFCVFLLLLLSLLLHQKHPMINGVAFFVYLKYLSTVIHAYVNQSGYIVCDVTYQLVYLNSLCINNVYSFFIALAENSFIISKTLLKIFTQLILFLHIAQTVMIFFEYIVFIIN